MKKHNPNSYVPRSLFFGLVAFLAVPSLLLCSEPILESDMIQKIKDLPSGLTGQPSFVLRSKHVRTVDFSGSALASEFGFVHQQGIIPQGLWMELKNQGKLGWAQARIQFHTPIDVSAFNSIVFWVKASPGKSRLRVGVQDVTWKNFQIPQGHTSAIPSFGFSDKTLVQVVVPLKLIYASTSKIDFSSLTEVQFEFGTQTAGNPADTIFDVYGVAFVQQKKLIPTVQLMNVVEEDIFSMIPADLENKVAAVPNKKKVRHHRVKEIKEDKDISFPLQSAPVEVEVQEKYPQQIHAPVGNNQLAATSTETPEFVISPSSVTTPALEAESKEVGSRIQSSNHSQKRIAFMIAILSALALAGIIGVWLLMTRKKTKGPVPIKSTLVEIEWPFLTEGSEESWSQERKFWLGLAEKDIRLTWLSPFRAFHEKQAPELYYGEEFLKRQLNFSKQAGVDLIPSLCFARTFYNYESFLICPQMFLTKDIPAQDIHLSDEELRVKYLGFFPVWIPPFWQKQHHIPQKMLVAYGKIPGMLPTTDSIQFDLKSKELKKMAKDLLLRLAAQCKAIRIEGAVAHLNSNLELYWVNRVPNYKPDFSNEFWKEVLATVRSKHPQVLFLADAVGRDVRKILEVGFNYFEYDQFRETLINQIILESVGPLKEFLTGENALFLESAIHNLTPLLGMKSSDAISRQQKILCSSILALLPGTISHQGHLPSDLNQFIDAVSRWPVLKKGRLNLLQTEHSDVLSFCRWDDKSLLICVANFSFKTKKGAVRLDQFMMHFDSKNLYLFNDPLFGLPMFKDVSSETSESPAQAVLGQDLIDQGLSVEIPPLSLRLFSVSLPKGNFNDHTPKVRQLHQA